MNKRRRAEIQHLIEKLEDLKSDIEMIKDEEQEYIENMPENLQSSRRYELAENAVSCMEDAYGYIEEAINYLEEATEEE